MNKAIYVYFYSNFFGTDVKENNACDNVLTMVTMLYICRLYHNRP